MKRTGKTLTLSGQIPRQQINQDLGQAPHTILEYSNVLDINKAWKVSTFRVWIHEGDGGELALTDDAYITLRAQLNTDEMPAINSMWNNAGENRALGWSNTLYNSLAPGYRLGVYANSGMGIVNQSYFIHPDHLIQNKLIIACDAKGGQSTENAFFTCNYIVYLEEYDITPTESIIFNIKGKGQDLSS